MLQKAPQSCSKPVAYLVAVLAILVANKASASVVSEGFDRSQAMTIADLSAIVTDSHVDFSLADMSNSYGGNHVESINMSNSFGIVAVNQNTGISANNMQTITMTIGNVSMGTK